MSKNNNILCISDPQEPFSHPDLIPFLKAVEKVVKPKHYIHMGDEIDNHALSDYLSDPDGYSAGHEFDRALANLKKFYKAFPNMKVCNSNHKDRVFKRAFKAGLPKKFLKEYKAVLEAPKGWQWADSWLIDGIVFEHGEKAGCSGQQAAKKHAEANMLSTVIGHWHSQLNCGIVQRDRKQLFFMVCGCLIDVESYTFKYNKKNKDKPVLGTGAIIDGKPVIFPMKLNAKGRWTGKL